MSFSRRDILKMFLGAPSAAAACRTGDKTPFPEGEIVGQNALLGHVLRENRTFIVPPDNWETKKVAIIGGGSAGLTAGWKLKKEDLNGFVLLELEREAGGT